MMQQLSLITLGVADLARSRRFYADGFGWRSAFENDEVLFFQMNGLVLGLWLADRLAADVGRPVGPSNGFALAHNLSDPAEIDPLLDRLVEFGGKLLRPADNPPHGGRRGYIADPDGHAWEIAWNPAWLIGSGGQITFGV